MIREDGSKEEIPGIPKIERISMEDLKPEIPDLDGTAIILQRHAKDNRDPNSPLELGILVPESAEQVRLHAKEFFDDIFRSLGPEAMKTVDILVVASDTPLRTPLPNVKSDHKRGVESAEQVLAGIQQSLKDFSLTERQLLNKSGHAIELSSRRIGELHAFEDSPEFIKFLEQKYGIGKEFWVAFENDDEKETRVQMGAEGPDEIADRVRDYLGVLENATRFYHQSHPGRRVIVWAVSHYDTISPFMKRHVANMARTDYLPVDNGAGVAIRLGEDQKASVQLQGHQYDFYLSSREAK